MLLQRSLSVCLSVTLVHPAKTAGQNEVPFGKETWVVTLYEKGNLIPMTRGFGGQNPQFAAMTPITKLLWFLLYRPKPIHCNYQLVHYSGFSRISPSILNRFKPNLQAQQCAKNHVSVHFLSFLAQVVSEHGAAAPFFVTLCLSRCSESLDCLTLA